MKFTPRKLNYFLAFKLPSAFLTGVRTKFIDNHKCVVVVKHRWINQNPFNSMFWAVQGMAAELATGKGQRFFLTTSGVDQNGDEVSSFEFEWSVKLKS